MDGRWLALGGVAAIAAVAGWHEAGSRVRLGPLLSSSPRPTAATWIPYEGKTLGWFHEQPSGTEFLLVPWAHAGIERGQWVTGANRFSEWLSIHPEAWSNDVDRGRKIGEIAVDLLGPDQPENLMREFLGEMDVYRLRHRKAGLDFKVPGKPYDASLGFVVDHAVAWRPPQPKRKKRKGSGVRLGTLLEGPRFLRAMPVIGPPDRVGAELPSAGVLVWSINIHGDQGRGRNVFEAWWDTQTRRMIFFADGPWRGNADLEVVNEDGSMAYYRNPGSPADRIPFSKAPEQLVALMTKLPPSSKGSKVRLGPLLAPPSDAGRKTARAVRQILETGNEEGIPRRIWDPESLNDFWIAALLRIPPPKVPAFVRAMAENIRPGWGALGVSELMSSWWEKWPLDAYPKQPSETKRDFLYDLGARTTPSFDEFEKKLIEQVFPFLPHEQLSGYLAYCREQP